jgi:hypothetical protein
MALMHRYTLICEDIRQENNGKWIVIGLYTHNIATPQLPFSMPGLAFLFCFEGDAEAVGQHRFKIRVQHLETGALILPELAGGMNVLRPGALVIPIRFPPLELRAHGVYSVSIEIEGHAAGPIATNFVVELAQRPTIAMPMQMPPFRS